MRSADELIALSNAVSESRIWSRLMELAEIGRLGETGVNRSAFSPEDTRAKRLVVGWAARLGTAAYQDAIGNLFIRYEPAGSSGQPVLTGSHLDSQPAGGRFDGAYGVVAALEVIEAFKASQVAARRPIEAVAWSNEEGGRFAPGAMGSQFFTGSLDLDSVKGVTDASGTRLEDALAETLDGLPQARARWRTESPYAYVEAHIEQGPVLENDGTEIGVVDGIQGCVWVEYTVRGLAAHAGTTPMKDRRDALREAMRLIRTLEEESLARAPDSRFTVGRCIVAPGSPNTIPDEVRFTIDFREPDPRRFAQVRDRLLDCDRAGPCRVESTLLFEHSPQPFDPETIAVVERAATGLGYSTTQLTSGAFHDALFISETCRTAMIFVPCTGGLSHHPDEYSSPEDLAAGARVLAATVHTLANEQGTCPGS